MIVYNRDVDLHAVEERVARKVLAGDGSLMMVEVHFEPGGVGEPHSHEEHEQVSYIAKGSFEVVLGSSTEVLHQGDSFYAAKNVSHGVRALEESIILDVFTPIRKDFLE